MGQVDRARTVKIIYFFDFLFSGTLCDCSRRFELKNSECTRCLHNDGPGWWPRWAQKFRLRSSEESYTADLFGQGAYRILKKRERAIDWQIVVKWAFNQLIVVFICVWAIVDLWLGRSALRCSPCSGTPAERTERPVCFHNLGNHSASKRARLMCTWPSGILSAVEPIRRPQQTGAEESARCTNIPKHTNQHTTRYPHQHTSQQWNMWKVLHTNFLFFSVF